MDVIKIREAAAELNLLAKKATGKRNQSRAE